MQACRGDTASNLRRGLRARSLRPEVWHSLKRIVSIFSTRPDLRDVLNDLRTEGQTFGGWQVAGTWIAFERV